MQKIIFERFVFQKRILRCKKAESFLLIVLAMQGRCRSGICFTGHVGRATAGFGCRLWLDGFDGQGSVEHGPVLLAVDLCISSSLLVSPMLLGFGIGIWVCIP